MFQTSLEKLQSKIRQGAIFRTSDEILPTLRTKKSVRTTKEKVQRRIVKHNFEPPFLEISRPGTPVVGTRLERYASSSGLRTKVPYETADMHTNNEMYKTKQQKGSATSRRAESIIRLSAKRCQTPLSIEKPLTKLCWNRHKGLIETLESDDDDEDDDILDVRRHHERHAPVHINTNTDYDVTLSDLENDNKLQYEPIQLTQNNVKTMHPDNVNKNQRIVQWLIDCEEKIRFNGSQLPSHLPDIMINARQFSSDSRSRINKENV